MTDFTRVVQGFHKQKDFSGGLRLDLPDLVAANAPERRLGDLDPPGSFHDPKAVDAELELGQVEIRQRDKALGSLVMRVASLALGSDLAVRINEIFERQPSAVFVQRPATALVLAAVDDAEVMRGGLGTSLDSSSSQPVRDCRRSDVKFIRDLTAGETILDVELVKLRIFRNHGEEA